MLLKLKKICQIVLIDTCEVELHPGLPDGRNSA